MSRQEMKRSPSVLPRIVAALGWAAILGCGGSAGLSSSETEYLASVPETADLVPASPSDALAQEGTKSSALLGRSEILGMVMRRIEETANMVRAISAGLDEIRSHPPTIREGNVFIWGPRPDPRHPGIIGRFVLVREEDEGGVVFQYRAQAKREGDAEFATVVAGAFRGERGRGATGEMNYNGVVARELGISDHPLIQGVHLGYELREEGARIGLRVEAIDPRTGLPRVEELAFAVRREGGGEFRTEGLSDLEHTPTPLPEMHALHVRWLPDGAGRLESVVTGGDLRNARAFYAECFNREQVQVFKAVRIECGDGPCDACPDGQRVCSFSEGDPSRCVLNGCDAR